MSTNVAESRNSGDYSAGQTANEAPILESAQSPKVPSAVEEILRRGGIFGLGESYINNDWNTEDLS